MGGDVGVALLKSLIFAYKMEILPPHDNGLLHFGRFDSTLQYAPSDGDQSRERTLAVNVVALDGFLRSLESQSDILPIPLVGPLGQLLLARPQILVSMEHVVLFLKRTLMLCIGRQPTSKVDRNPFNSGKGAF